MYFFSCKHGGDWVSCGIEVDANVTLKMCSIIEMCGSFRSHSEQGCWPLPRWLISVERFLRPIMSLDLRCRVSLGFRPAPTSVDYPSNIIMDIS